jgi:hypothetical protein
MPNYLEVLAGADAGLICGGSSSVNPASSRGFEECDAASSA